jgi:hypothetical protein
MTSNNVAAFANKAFVGAKSDHWESAFYTKGASRRAKATAKKEAKRAVRHSAHNHIADY